MNKFLLVLLIAFTPTIALLLRGVLWGADSFAFLSVSCGNVGIEKLGHPFFAQFVPLFNCNFYLIITVMFIFYFLSLIALWVFGNYLFKNKGYLLPIVVGSIGVLFFFEAMRFENQLFGVTLSLIAIGLFTLYLLHNKSLTGLFALFLAIITALISILFWFPSIFILPLAFFVLKLPNWVEKIVLLIIIVAGIIFYGPYALHSFTQLVLFPSENMIAEELPIIGIVFILHIIHFRKNIPKNLYWYSIILIIIGLVKIKYMFIATIVLSIGLVVKELSQGLYIRQTKLPIVPLAIYFLILLLISSQFVYPTQNDVTEINELIQKSNETKIPIYNDWGQGWLFESLGYETQYKISRPNPDYETLTRPFYAYTTQKINNCTQTSKRTFECN